MTTAVNVGEIAKKLGQAAALLGEALAYLDRLPQIPTTVELANRIGEFVEGQAREQIAAAADIVRENESLQGALFLPTGLPVIQAKLVDRVLHLKSPHIGNKVVAAQVVDALKGAGIAMQMSKGGDS